MERCTLHVGRWVTKMIPKGTKIEPQRPKTLLEPGCRWKLVSEPFWALFGTPRDPEYRALAVARCYFLLILRHAPAQNLA